MFEYLRNIGALRQVRNQVIALRIRIPDSDGAPARLRCSKNYGQDTHLRTNKLRTNVRRAE